MKKGLQDEEEEFEQYEIGNIVKHEIFGKGTILEPFDNGSYQVQFEKAKRTIRGCFLALKD